MTIGKVCLLLFIYQSYCFISSFYTGSSVFTESLFYEPQHNGSQAQYAGNISAIDWKVIRPNATNNQLGYIFTYDKLNRLTSAGYKQNSSSTDIYDTQYTYDLMGNILSLQRNGLHDNNTYDVIDDLSYTYNGNHFLLKTSSKPL